MKLLNVKIRLEELWAHVRESSDAPVKLIFVILYIAGAFLVRNTQADVVAAMEHIEYASPLAVFAAQNLLAVYLIAAGIAVTILILMPIGKRAVQEQLKSIGLVNHSEEVPELKRKTRDKQNPRVTVWEFSNRGIPLKV